jgi:exonuclease SbcC
MRILNIHFKNINSLEGEGRVSFDQGPIADSGVFAITGPNGSGKTSILDVITLGLYGETFRFDKPAQHIITKHTNDSFAEVEFAFNGEKYRSSWQVQRDNTAMPTMALQRLNGSDEILAETPFQVRNYLVELTGMDFHKFSKAIVLPQGEFAAFLNALDSERLDILEKISGSDLYADYRQQLESRHRQLVEKTTFLTQELELLPLLSAAALEAAEHDLHDYHDLTEDLKNQQQQIKQQLLNVQNIEALDEKHRKLSHEQQHLQTLIEQHQADLQRIASQSQAASFQVDMRTLDRMQAEADQSRATLQNSRGELDRLQQQLSAAGINADTALPHGKSFAEQKQLIGNIKLKLSELKLELPRLHELAKTINGQLADKKLGLEETNVWLQANQHSAVLLTQFPDVVQLRNVRTNLLELAAQQKSQHNWSKKSTNDQKKNSTALTTTQARISELKEQIVANQNTLLEISKGLSLEALKELYSDQEIRQKDFEELLSLANVNARFSKRKILFSWFGDSKEKEEEYVDEAELQSRVDSLRLELSKEENIGRALEQSINNEQILKKLADQRSKLVDGKPCFLCGSPNHPYVSKPPILTDSKKALADQRTRTQLTRARLSDVEKQLLAAQKRSKQMTAKQKFVQEKRAEWIALTNRLNIVREGLDINNIPMQETLLLEEADELERIKKLMEQYSQLQRDIIKAKAEIPEKQELLAKLRLTHEQLGETWAEHSPELTEADQTYKQLQNQEKSLIATLEPQLKLLGEKLPAKNKENALFDRLNSLRQDYQIRDLRQKGLQDEIADLQEKLQACQTTIVRFQQEENSHLHTLRQEEMLGLQLAVVEKQQLIAAQESTAQEQSLGLEGMRLAILEKIAIQGFNSLEEVHTLLALIERQTDIEAEIAALHARSAKLASEQQQLDIRLQTEIAALGEVVALGDLQAMDKHVAEQLDISAQEIHTLQNKLEKQAQYRQKYQVLETELLAVQQTFAEADAELQQINQDQGGLRRRIQQLLINKLLAQTNLILEKISGRYKVCQAESLHGLALEIEDRLQNNVRRLPKTLSGGESFVASLALALALAEIANNGKAIESLFLDEGFGNLDADSLYLAIGALESLKTQGRTVGVISHVEAVKKRIKTQIELVKKTNGLSELKMVA